MDDAMTGGHTGSAEPTTYVPILELAAGGMGTVSICVRRSGAFERLYAVKRLHPHLRGDPSMRSMFLDEARMSGLLRHANVVPVLDVGQDHDGPFMVMDYIEGLSISRFIRQHAARGDLIPEALCLHVAAQTARGLHAAHEMLDPDGTPLLLVHRDVSPQNILLGRDGVVRVTDFGIAKALGRSTHTSTGLLKGKVGYMSPEQLRFEPIDRRCDLFALGIVLTELLTGRRVFPGKDAAAVARQILSDPPPDLGDLRPEVSPAVVELAFELLAKSPDSRPSTAAEVATRLEDMLAEHGPVDVGSYIEEHFGEDLDLTRAAVRNAASLQQAATPVDPAVSTAIVTVAPKRRRTWLGALGVSSAVLLAAAWGWTRAQAPESTSQQPAAAADGTVDVFIESRPSGARVRLAGQEVGLTPILVPVTRQDDAVLLELELEGHVLTRESIVPIEDTRLLIALAPTPPEPTPAAGPGASEPPAASAPRKSKARPKARRKRTSPPADDKPVFRRFD